MTATVGVIDVYGPAAPPRSNGELAFAEPWESRAFGLALALHDKGAFDWEDFRHELIATIATWTDAVTSSASGNEPWSYYRCWLRALESVLAARGLVGPAEVEARARALAERPAGHDHDHDHHDHDHHDHDHHDHDHHDHGDCSHG